jgi:hypothetical protein
MTDQSPPSFTKKRLPMVLAGGVAGVIVGLAGVYGIGTLTRNAGGDAACRPAVELAKKVAPFARGEVAAVNVAKSPLKVPDLAFADASGKPQSLADFRGRTERRLGSPGFEVVAVNIDTRDPEKPKDFLKQIGVTKLAYFTDPSARTFQDLKSIGRAFGMPTSLLVDPHGCEIGTIAGPAEWASDDAIKLVEAAIGK